ncbi:MAG: hypothetical protein IKZ43_05965 [Acidaminococcaceae bacterium]|nr:hypothetical protein [Acidaminococcaceae bacterium]
MRRLKIFSGMVRLLVAGLWLAGLAICPPAGEAALPTHPQPSASAAEVNAADKVWKKVNNEDSIENVQKSKPQQERVAGQTAENVTRPAAAPVAVPANPAGYTEAELRERMVKQYTPPKPAFRRVSGAAAGSDYRPGTLDVKIPSLFFPKDELKDVSESFTENPDGTFGTRAPGDALVSGSGYSAAAQRQLQEEQWRKVREEQKGTVQAGGQNKAGSQVSAKPSAQAAPARGKQKTITVQVLVPVPSPFRPLSKGDFYWFNNSTGHYLAVLPGSLSQDPLLQVPATGPMLIRDAGQNEFMAITTDDPSDTYYYKNQDTFPSYGKVAPVFEETRKTFQGDDVSIKYIRRYLGGEYCLIVDSAAKKAGKTYRMAVVFPERKQNEYLPKALYAIENLKAY